MITTTCDTKSCTRCGEVKPVGPDGEFSTKGKLRDGSPKYASRCKLCAAEEKRERYAANPEAARDAARKYREANLEAERERSRKRYWADPEASREARRESERKRYWANPEEARERGRSRRKENLEAERARDRERYWANPEAHRERYRKWREADPDAARAAHRRSTNNTRAKRREELPSLIARVTSILAKASPNQRRRLALQITFAGGVRWQSFRADPDMEDLLADILDEAGL